MSDLSATNCGCGCETSCGGCGNGMSSCLHYIITSFVLSTAGKMNRKCFFTKFLRKTLDLNLTLSVMLYS